MFLQKVILQFDLKKFSWLKKLKILWLGHVISDINGEEIVGIIYEKELQETNHKGFRVEQVIKRKDDKLYVTWKGFHNSFNGWINKEDTV